MVKNLIVVLSIGAFFGIFGCGVKGKPLPPEEPASIGRGQEIKSTESVQAPKAWPMVEGKPLVLPKKIKTKDAPKKKPAKK
ncbi:MAG: hypothetical protein ACK5P5_08130 [Pseudobdellovibrionaceae bacterium]